MNGNPGFGGWGAIFIYGKHEKEIHGGEERTTNNKMELMAVVEALKMIKRPCECVVYSDSTYVVNAFEEKWIYSWVKNKWRTSSNKPVKNVELWKKLLSILGKHGNVSFVKVKAHSGDEYNERCDDLAKKAVLEQKWIVQNKKSEV